MIMLVGWLSKEQQSRFLFLSKTQSVQKFSWQLYKMVVKKKKKKTKHNKKVSPNLI